MNFAHIGHFIHPSSLLVDLLNLACFVLVLYCPILLWQCLQTLSSALIVSAQKGHLMVPFSLSCRSSLGIKPTINNPIGPSSIPRRNHEKPLLFLDTATTAAAIPHIIQNKKYCTSTSWSHVTSMMGVVGCLPSVNFMKLRYAYVKLQLLCGLFPLTGERDALFADFAPPLNYASCCPYG